ncbi:MAG: nuclear transport factor 2 family protein [Phycisphaerales bacterium]|nr:MAG: nuclear transport factor 2 family protein [Phycisphaerales bacterium]
MTTTRSLLWAILAFGLLLMGCQQSGPAVRPLLESDIAAIRNATEQYRVAESVNDWQAVTMLYTENAIRMLPEGPTIQGREAILKEFDARPYSVTQYDQQIEEAEGFGDLAVVRGVFSYAVDRDGEILRGTGKYIAVYRRQLDGTWLIDRDIFNLDAASP